MGVGAHTAFNAHRLIVGAVQRQRNDERNPWLRQVGFGAPGAREGRCR